ncbi:MAG: helix-turn-helix transcriptional regulator [Caldimicrobium sp.]|nr:helix-turn-helix transcriptional regulator [Caldimicrobium sp.]MCX7613308.1 helix-turn-helix transcriptional regulator [Caldimicrobium sp.]MDW8183411.1 LuxR C-terminal-related transcriptional regulator [Caldimicrobium sp.]
MKKFTFKPKVYLDFFESFPGYIAVLDEKGNIIATNKTWQEAALKRGLIARSDCIGYNYLKLLEQVSEEEKKDAEETKWGLLEVLQGRMPLFKKLYRFHDSNKTQKEYLLTFFRLTNEPKLFVILHEELPKGEPTQETSSKEEPVSTSPSAEWITFVDKVINPFLELLKGSLPTELETLRAHISEEVKRFIGQTIRDIHPLAGLSTKEAQIALMVREGYSSEEICKYLNLSKEAINFYRKRIREKFGIKGKKISLKKYLDQLL